MEQKNSSLANLIDSPNYQEMYWFVNDLQQLVFNSKFSFSFTLGGVF